MDRLTEGELAALIRRITDELSGRGTREGFAELLQIVGYVGQRVGVRAVEGVAHRNHADAKLAGDCVASKTRKRCGSALARAM